MAGLQPAPAPVQPAVFGLVETVSQGRLVGWAHDPVAVHAAVEVTIRDALGREASALADIYRADLHQAGIGDGHAGFAIRYDRLSSGGPLKVVAGPDVVLQGSPVCLRASRSPLARRAGPLLFGIDQDHLSGTRVSGWAHDRHDARRPLPLGLIADGQVVSQTRTSRYRPDRSAKGAPAFCGFVLDWPATSTRLWLVDLRDGRRLARIR